MVQDLSFAASPRVWRKVLKKPLNRIYLGVMVVAIVNFVSFFLIAIVLGGDAVNGKIEGGRYLLAAHGKYRAVSEAVFTYSLWHARSVFVTHPLALLCGFLLVGQVKSVADTIWADRPDEHEAAP